MKIGIIGAGYVGLVTGVCLSESGNEVICMDKDVSVVENLRQGICPIFEPLLEDLLRKNIKEDRIKFTGDLKIINESSEIIFLCLPTPPDNDGFADTTALFEVSRQIAQLLKESKIIVTKSTIPVGTSDKIKNIFKNFSAHRIRYIFNPEFLKEGNAVNDFMSPDRVIIGSGSAKAIEIIKDLYSAFLRTSDRFIVMDEKSAELTKYASNCMLATRISFMNQMAQLCEKTGANIDFVRAGVGSDSRIGERYLFAGVGYGGSCFPKDIKALIRTSEENGINLNILKAVEETNAQQISLLIQKINRHFGEKLNGKKFSVWGLSFKPKTDDIRESPALKIIKKIIDDGGVVYATDPVSIDKGKAYFKKYSSKVKFFENN